MEAPRNDEISNSDILGPTGSNLTFQAAATHVTSRLRVATHLASYAHSETPHPIPYLLVCKGEGVDYDAQTFQPRSNGDSGSWLVKIRRSSFS